MAVITPLTLSGRNRAYPCIVIRPNGLTDREWEVVQLLVQGAPTSVAAEALHISPRTIETHVASVYRKLGISSRRELTSRVT